MSLYQIETELNARFADYNKSSPRNIIFWYDKDGQYADEVEDIPLCLILLISRSPHEGIYQVQ